ncbi:cobalt-precorrin-6A reductase [Leptolyngbya sp. FACHB-541]|uniref:cobalt-precorrin-6A reductase n=1 Tax=Leptolyngbya sp. FACHB-541 TaxID=2692810 RepID=UPI0016838FB1|nr:cobalt-precorrin-6A reductase [Leptolyngbya sp. FACHB-541]MBD1998518.1 cobalt-precorrin-6A reductase [Leptolyngbya sp. FACHB-541]
MFGQVWLIGGTQESVQLARAIAYSNLPCIVTVTTESARSLYCSTPSLQVWVGRLSEVQLKDFLQTHQISCILDASHPFAVEVSRMAIAAAAKFQLPYLRYERPSLDENSSSNQIILDNFGTLVAGDYLKGQRVLLVVGYRPLEQFRSWQSQATLFARILPSVTALEAALAAGFTPDRLIALRPPISADLERALWQQWQISMVVSKASGVAGGEDVKRQVAVELGVKWVTIARPPVSYPQQTGEVAIALEFCRQHYTAGSIPN